MARLFNSLYALILRKKQVVVFFYAITLTHFIVGMYVVGMAFNKLGTR